MAQVVGQLLVEMSANVARLKTDMDRATSVVSKATRDIDRAIAGVKNSFAALGVGSSAAAFGSWIKGAIDAADEIGKLAQRTGISTEALSGLKYAADLSGVTLEELSGGIRKLNKAIADNDPALQRMGVTATNAEDALAQLADRFAAMEDGPQKAAMAVDIFGKSGDKMIPLLNQGSAGIAKLTEEASRLGLVISKDTARAAEEFNDNLTRLKASADGAAVQIGNSLLPMLNRIIEQFNLGIKAAGGLGNAILDLGTINPLRSVQGNIAKLSEELESLKERAAKRPSWQTSLTDNTDREIQRVERQIEYLKSIQRMRAMQGFDPEKDLDARDLMARGSRSTFTPAPAAGSAPKASRASVRDLFGEALASMREQENGLRKITEYERTLWEVQSGRLKSLTEPQKNILLDQAQYLDNLHAQIDAEAELKRSQEALKAEGEAVAQSVRTPLEALQAEQERLMNLLANEAIDGEVFERAMQAAQQVYDEHKRAQWESLRAQQDALWEGLQTEEEMLAQSYARRAEMILNSTIGGEGQRQELLRRLNEKFVKEQEERQLASLQAQYQAGEQLFDGLAGLAKAFAGEQSGAYRVLFAASKAFAIADATIKLQQAVAAAAASGPFPWNLGAMASVAAATSGVLSTILSTNYAGAFDKGGMIPAGQWGLVGERGPEIVQGPASVTSRVDTAAMLGGQQSIRIINAFDTQAVGDYIGSDAGERVIMNVVKRNAATMRQVVGG